MERATSGSPEDDRPPVRVRRWPAIINWSVGSRVLPSMVIRLPPASRRFDQGGSQGTTLTPTRSAALVMARGRAFGRLFVTPVPRDTRGYRPPPNDDARRAGRSSTSTTYPPARAISVDAQRAARRSVRLSLSAPLTC